MGNPCCRICGEIWKLSFGCDSGGNPWLNWHSGSVSCPGIVGAVEELTWDGPSPVSNDRVRGLEDRGGDGIEKLEREGEGELSGALNGSFAGGLTASSTTALARCRL